MFTAPRAGNRPNILETAERTDESPKCATHTDGSGHLPGAGTRAGHGQGRFGDARVRGQAGHDRDSEPRPRPAATERGLDQSGQLIPEQATPSGQSLFDGVLAQVQCLGDLGRRTVLAVEEDQGLAIDRGDSLERLPDEGLLLARDRDLGGARLLGGELGEGLLRRGGFERS